MLLLEPAIAEWLGYSRPMTMTRTVQDVLLWSTLSTSTVIAMCIRLFRTKLAPVFWTTHIRQRRQHVLPVPSRVWFGPQ